MTIQIRKAVFPVAGLGTRFLPATKASPKEMLPIVDKPLIQYAVEEAIEAGVTELIFITSSYKRAIADHFDSNYELEAKLLEAGKQELLDKVRQVKPTGVSCVFMRQPETLGLGHAVGCAEPLVGDEPFAVILADDLIDTTGEGCLKQMLQVEQGASVIAVQQVPRSHTERYGMVAVEKSDNGFSRIQQIVEKPLPQSAPSDLGVVGRYILPGEIFEIIRNTHPGSGGEIQLTDAIATLLNKSPVYAYQFDGIRYDCGSKLGYLQATVELGAKHPEVGDAFSDYLLQRFC